MTTEDIQFVLKLDKKNADRKDYTYFNIINSNIGKIVNKAILTKYINEHSNKDCFKVEDLDVLSKNTSFLKEAAEIGSRLR